MSPEAYRVSAGFRRSTSLGTAIAPIGHNGGPAISNDWSLDPNPLAGNYVFEDLKDPRLADFLSGGRHSAAGVYVGERMALRNSTFFRAVNLISATIGMLPIHLMRNLDGGDTEEAKDHPFYSVLKLKPNEYQTPLEFKSHMQTVALLDGNAYARVVRGFSGGVISLVPLKRGSITPLLSADSQLTFRYNRPDGRQVALDASEVFHFRSMISCDGLHGIGLLDVATQSLGIAVQAERAAARIFKDGLMAGGALQTEQTLGDEAIEHLRRSLEERYSGADKAGKFLILEEGMKLVASGATPKDSQHLETRKHQDEEIARFTGVPRPLLMFDETAWGTGIEQLGQFFVTYCLLAWFVAWEQGIERCLAPSELGVLFAKFNAGALLRGSLKDQAEFFAKALGAGGSQAWMTPDEVRENFDTNKIPGGADLPARMAAKPPTDPAKEPA